jgi:SAM-dependent methyltransferase
MLSPLAASELGVVLRKKMMNTNNFYASLTPLYHLIYPDWDKSIQRQAAMLNSVIRESCVDALTVLDVSCGIGTQAIGLAKLGYNVTASDLSPEEVKRAKQEAALRNLSVAFSVADMRQVFNHHARQFDVVISCDNSVPHLLSDEDILTAFRQFYQATRPGGCCIITVRDYEKEDFSKQQIKPYSIREDNGIRWLIWQVWDPHPPTYDLTMYFVEDRGGPECTTHVMHSIYYAVGIQRLQELMRQAGFEGVRRLDDRFFQPMVLGTKKGTTF